MSLGVRLSLLWLMLLNLFLMADAAWELSKASERVAAIESALRSSP